MRELYIILNEDNTFYSQWFLDGEQPENAIKYTYTDNFVKPKFNASEMKAYESATDEEIEEYYDSIYPEKVTALQFKMQALIQGLNDDIDNAINNLPEPNKSIAKLKYEYATEFIRKDVLVITIGQIIGLSKKEINEFFLNASKLE
mgnify:FL=1